MKQKIGEKIVIKEIVFSGGHMVAILQYAGAIAEIEDGKTCIDMRQCHRFLGSSAGAILALLLAIDFKPIEIINIFRRIPPKKLFNPKSNDCISLFDKYGIASTVPFKKIFEQSLLHKGFEKNTTFLELYNKIKKDVSVTTFCVNSNKVCILNYETSPNLPIAQALCMSMAIPFIFKPVSYKNRLYVDTILINTFPIDHVKNTESFIGFNLNQVVKYDERMSLWKYLNLIYSGVEREISKHKEKKWVDINRILTIKSNFVHSYDFNMDEDEINRHIKIGRNKIIPFAEKLRANCFLSK